MFRVFHAQRTGEGTTSSMSETREVVQTPAELREWVRRACAKTKTSGQAVRYLMQNMWPKGAARTLIYNFAYSGFVEHERQSSGDHRHESLPKLTEREVLVRRADDGDPEAIRELAELSSRRTRR
jgi:hypothetical protein